jgi:predicted RNA-binding protein YlxR (DUF448 family)
MTISAPSVKQEDVLALGHVAAESVRASDVALAGDVPSEPDEPDAALRQRTCVGCRTHEESAALLRIAYLPQHDPFLIPDVAGKLGGRGLWLHPSAGCVRKALRGGFARALRREVNVSADAILEPLQTQLTRRIQGLLLAALRRRRATFGTDAVLEVLATCPVSLLLVAKDAAGRRNDVISRASERGVRVVEIFDQGALGRLTQREALNFVAVLEPQIGREIADASRWLAGLSEDG